MSSWGSPLLDPKKLQNEQFDIIDWIRKKLLVDVANLAPCCLLLLAAPCCCLLLLTYLPLTCCCLPAAHRAPVGGKWCSPWLVALGAPPQGDTQGKQQGVWTCFLQFLSKIDANIAFLVFRILARSVSFRCQVSTHRRFLDLHVLGNAQIIPTTAPDAMLMSRCPTGPKSTYLLFPRPHNGTGCYVNEPVPELIYAMLDFRRVDFTQFWDLTAWTAYFANAAHVEPKWRLYWEFCCLSHFGLRKGFKPTQIGSQTNFKHWSGKQKWPSASFHSIAQPVPINLKDTKNQPKNGFNLGFPGMQCTPTAATWGQ